MRPLTFCISLAALVLFTNCSGNRETAALVPDWVAQSPVKSGYYVGIGSASKLVHPLDADAVAKQNALDNLSREIRVQVQSTSSSNALQVNGWLSESFESSSRSTTNEDLEGFTLVDTYSNDTEVFAYYQLSKAEHERIQKAKREAALSLALENLRTARGARQRAQVQKVVDAAVRGLDALAPFLDKPLTHVEENGDVISVPQELVGLLEDCVAGLQLAAVDSSMTLVVADAYRGEAFVTALLDGLPAPNIALSYRYERGEFPTRGESVTNAQGMATIVLEKFEPSKKQAVLDVQVDPTAFVKGLPLTHPFRQAVEGLQSAPLRIDVDLAPVALRVRIEERAFGKKRDQSVLAPAIRQGLQDANVRILAEDAPSDMTLVVEADARPGGSGQGFSTVYVDLVGTVTNNAGETIFTQTLTNIKGIQLDVPRATDAAYGKAADAMSTEFVPDLVRLWHGF